VQKFFRRKYKAGDEQDLENNFFKGKYDFLNVEK